MFWWIRVAVVFYELIIIRSAPSLAKTVLMCRYVYVVQLLHHVLPLFLIDARQPIEMVVYLVGRPAAWL